MFLECTKQECIWSGRANVTDRESSILDHSRPPAVEHQTKEIINAS